jgi:hypothetical protein
VHVRHPSYRLVTRADAPFPDGTSESEWRLTRSRHSDDVNAEVREAIDRDGYSLFPGFVARGNSELIKRSFAQASFLRRNRLRHRTFSPQLHLEEEMMGRGILLWLLGVPIPVIILLWLFFGTG